MEYICAFLLTSVYIEWTSLNRYIQQKIKKSTIEPIGNYKLVEKYITGISHIVFYHVDKKNNIFLIGQITSNFGLNNLKGQWFVMTATLINPIIDFELYKTLGMLIDDLDFNQQNILETHMQIQDTSATIIQKYFRGWKTRIKYRYNPNTSLGKYLLCKEFESFTLDL